MTIITGDFLDLVRRMRAKQVEYFKTRDTTILRESKDLERRVDEAIKAADQKPDLFSNEPTLE